MGQHLGIISLVFNDNSIGSDLEFADIKTNKQTKRPKIYVKVKDFSIPFWIIWDFTENKGFIVKVKDFKKLEENKIAKSIYMNEIKQKSIFTTNNLIDLKLQYEKISGELKNEIKFSKSNSKSV